MIVLLFKMMFQDILFIMMRFIPDHFKRKEIYNKVMCNNPYVLKHSLIILIHTKCVIRQLRKAQGYLSMSLISIRHRRCAMKQSRNVHSSCGMSLIGIRPKKCVIRQLRKSHGYRSMFLIGLLRKGK